MAGDLSAVCDRARRLSSAALDGEASELEAVLVRRHVARCAACREWAAGVGHVTALIRSAPAEEPSRHAEVAPPRESAVPVVQEPRRRFRLRYGLAVCGIALSAVLGGFFGAIVDRPSRPSGEAPAQFSFLRSSVERGRAPARAPSPARPPRGPDRPTEGAV